MHSSVLEWASKTFNASNIEGKRVLEVGSYNVNGSVRPIALALKPGSYLGVDQGEGPDVDQVCNATELVNTFGAGAFNVVISTEMLEHVVEWQPIIKEMVEVLAQSGLLVLTTRSPGFPYHPYPIDTWRYTLEAMGQILVACELENIEVVPDPEVPGVFATARKPENWVAPWRSGLFDNIPVQPMMVPELE